MSILLKGGRIKYFLEIRILKKWYLTLWNLFKKWILSFLLEKKIIEVQSKYTSIQKT